MSSSIRFRCDACGKRAKGVSPSHLYVYDDPPEGWIWSYGRGVEGPHACSKACWDKVDVADDGRIRLPYSHENIRRVDAQARAMAAPRETEPPPPPPKPPSYKEVYFIQRGENGPVKIGVSRNVAARLKSLQGSVPEPLRVLAYAPGTMEDERRLHSRFEACRLSGEWFRPERDLLSYIGHVAERRAL